MATRYSSSTSNSESADSAFQFHMSGQLARIHIMEDLGSNIIGCLRIGAADNPPGLSAVMFDLKLEFLEGQYKQFIKTHEEMANIYSVQLNYHYEPGRMLEQAFEAYRNTKEMLVSRRYKNVDMKSPMP